MNMQQEGMPGQRTTSSSQTGQAHMRKQEGTPVPTTTLLITGQAHMKPGIDYTGIAVVFYCHDGNGNFVMDLRGKNSRDEQGKWEIGAGKLQFGEDPIEGLRREVQEEYCVVPKEIEFLGIRNAVRDTPEGKSHWIMLDYKVLVDPAQVTNGEPEKLDAVEWFVLDNLPEPRHSLFDSFIQKYKDRL